jgi:DNA-binding CsgD family transcriptional regulator
MQEVRGFDTHRLHTNEQVRPYSWARVWARFGQREPEGSQLGLSCYLANGGIVRTAGQATPENRRSGADENAQPLERVARGRSSARSAQSADSALGRVVGQIGQMPPGFPAQICLRPLPPNLRAVCTYCGSDVYTPRELEIARLAATGLTDKVIAERLHLSPRTVQNKLYGVYAKLGVTGRTQLCAALESS